MNITFSKKALPSQLEGQVLISRSSGRPRYWATVWAVFLPAYADSTRSELFHYIDSFYAFTDLTLGPDGLDRAIAQFDLEKIGTALEAYFTHIQNSQFKPYSLERKWRTSFDFVQTVLTLIGKSENSHRRFDELNAKINRLNRLYKQLRVRKPTSQDSIRALPATVVEQLWLLTDPGSPENLFRTAASKWRAYLVFVLLLRLGLRRGELLTLRADCVSSEYNAKTNRMVYWITIRASDDRFDDPRHTQPSLKNDHAVRQIPIAESTAKIIRLYLENYRGKVDHPFLLSSQWRQPLTPEAVAKLMRKFTRLLSPDHRKQLQNRIGRGHISAHDFRHTCCVIRLSQFLDNGDDMELALQKLRSYFGWSRDSDMPRKYAKSVFVDRMSSVWDNAFDDRISILRKLDGPL